MITPSFGLTATERVLPKLALDFTTASLDPRVTFTRTGNTATRVNSSGYIETALADTPRFDYDPTTLACKGLLIEEARTNYQKYSSTFSSWNTYGTAPTLTAIASPTGANDGTLFEDTGSGYFGKTINNGTFSANTYTISLFVKQGTAASFGVWVLGSVDSFFFQDSIGWGPYPIGTGWSYTAMKDGWYRVWKTFTGTASQTLTTYLIAAGGGTAPSGTTGFYGVQLETGSFPTSYIPNNINGSTLRNADVATMTGTNFSDWFNASEGTFETQFTSNGYVANEMLFSASPGDLSAIIQAYWSGASTISADGGASASMSISGVQNTASKFVYAYKLNNYAMSINAAIPSIDGSGTPPNTLSQLNIGHRNGSLVGNQHIRKLLYWSQRITNAEVQSFSK